MSRFLTPSDADHISDFLSAPRLKTFLDLTRSGLREDAIELHQATMSLGVAIMAVTGLIEVSLRNAACRRFDMMFERADWLMNPPQGLQWQKLESSSIKRAQNQARRAAYSKMTGPQKTALDEQAFPNGKPMSLPHEDVASRRQATIHVADSQIIAQLTMHFWKRLFSDQYEAMLWKRGLRKIFPNKGLSRADVASQLEVIYEARNRLAHHEPVYGSRLDAVLEAISFVSNYLGNRDPDVVSPFAKLIMPQRDILSGQVAIMRSTFDRLTPSR
ncbi:hypothetical protein [Yoonia vestfoldensis]|uniref:Abi-like protein n=1 Tax=Yoonia vestfoldensis TaxID=245188 RepID=A0A1Y0E702_9RHOB|nr:hypothetical protein [Yoonia vestfoldensis]ART99395.1 hypothetical protein LOKVESSMR4R_00047 [Yoonia vestfoldensis]